VATSAVRDAENRDEFLALLRDRFGIEARTITGEEEARLTFLGATAGRELPAGPVVVIDIGGGSTELVSGEPGRDPGFSVSTPVGSVRQTERHLRTDPPAASALETLCAEVRRTVRYAVPFQVREGARRALAVAGTATSLAAIEQRLDPYDPERVDGYRLRLEAAERMFGMLAGMPLEERREVTGLHPGRAPTIVAGAAILVEGLHALGLEEALVSESDILHGIAREAAAGA
jgi:exopolyphosphatase/guanosine-5'-triphosphate,3'-diphosphate pyrophosphatase